MLYGIVSRTMGCNMTTNNNKSKGNQLILETFMSDQEKAQFEKSKIAKSSDTNLEKYLLILYDNQTTYEKIRKKTIQHNNIGYNSPDAQIMTQITDNLLVKGGLSREEGYKARQVLQKYHSQIFKGSVYLCHNTIKDSKI